MNNWEYSYNGLTFGGAQDIGVTNIEGLDSPDVREDESDRVGDDGSWFYGQYVGARVITFTGDVRGTPGADFEGKINSMRAAFLPQAADLVLQLQIPGDVKKQINCRRTRFAFPITPDYGIGYAEWTLEMKAQDPRIYEQTLNSVLISKATSHVINNIGLFSTYPVIRFNGPTTNPYIDNQTSGGRMKLNTPILAGHYVDVDFFARTITDDAGLNQYGFIDSTYGVWWKLQPGGSTIFFQADSGAGQARVQWRSAWL